MTVQYFDDAHILTLMQSYRDADYRWELGGHWQELRVGGHAATLEAAYPAGQEFGLLSAWNPYSVVRPEQTNRVADEALNAALLASGVQYRPGFSSARNRTWREPSWVVIDMAIDEFDRLARRFGQLGTLFWRRGEPARLRMYRTQPAAGAEDAYIDWIPTA